MYETTDNQPAEAQDISPAQEAAPVVTAPDPDEALTAAMQDDDDLSAEELALLRQELSPEAPETVEAPEMPEAAAAAEVPEADGTEPIGNNLSGSSDPAEPGAAPEPEQAPSVPAGTDQFSALQHFQQELQALRQRHPESRGEAGALAPEVLRDYFSTGNLENAWLSWQQKQQAEEIADLKQQLITLRQNQASAQRAPIRRGIAGTGAASAMLTDEARQAEINARTYGFDLPYW